MRKLYIYSNYHAKFHNFIINKKKKLKNKEKKQHNSKRKISFPKESEQ